MIASRRLALEGGRTNDPTVAALLFIALGFKVQEFSAASSLVLTDPKFETPRRFTNLSNPKGRILVDMHEDFLNDNPGFADV